MGNLESMQHHNDDEKPSQKYYSRGKENHWFEWPLPWENIWALEFSIVVQCCNCKWISAPSSRSDVQTSFQTFSSRTHWKWIFSRSTSSIRHEQINHRSIEEYASVSPMLWFTNHGAGNGYRFLCQEQAIRAHQSICEQVLCREFG